MALSDVVKELFMKKYYTFAFDSETAEDITFVVPENSIIEEIASGALTETGNVVVAVKRGTTTLGSNTSTVAATGTCTMVNIPIFKCETLHLTIAATAATGIGVTIAVRPVFDEE